MADDLMQLQRQAAHRVRQMQEHSRRVFEAHQGYPPQPLTQPDWTEQLSSPGLYHRPSAEPPAPPKPPPAPPPTLTLPRLDEEQWLLLGLAFLLFQNGCQPELVLALLYLAL
ncbi:MAG: hypothetical protein E7527_05120 [Ruminococcaceae bacterium]|nr:hypothetical protein [Oscillospiraceae bacterium]